MWLRRTLQTLALLSLVLSGFCVWAATDMGDMHDPIWVDERTGAWGPVDPRKPVRLALSAAAVFASPALVMAVTASRRAAVAKKARRRASVGLCRRCGYDLRGTPDRCPECGTINKAAEVIGGATGDRR